MKKILLMMLMFAPLATFAQKFGHINAQEVMSQMPEFIKARGEMEAKAKQFENDLKSTMNATKQQETENELNGLYQKYQQALQDNQQTLSKEQQEKMQPITTKLVNAIKAVGKAGGYVYIMDVSSGIPYISDTLSKDVTAEVKAQLNKLK